jgi:hypothetical protein
MFVIFCTIQQADANEIVLEKDFAGYFDSEGIYTVVGKINNAQEYPVIPTITITIQDNASTITESYQLGTIYPTLDQPFKFKFPQVISSNPILKEPQVLFTMTEKKIPLNVEVIYDDTLVTHDDGHKTGRIINKGDKTVENVKIYALIYDSNWKLLDMGKNVEMIEKIEPGQIVDFSMYPDPLFSPQAQYYSCFVIGDEAIIPVNTIRNGIEYNYRYDSGIWFAYPEFNEDSTSLLMKMQNSWPLEMYANFEFPKLSDNEKFSVYLNNEQIKSIQSIDEFGNWHIAFVMAPHTSGNLLINGFGEEPVKIQENESAMPNDADYLYYVGGIISAVVIAGTFIFYKNKRKSPKV